MAPEAEAESSRKPQVPAKAKGAAGPGRRRKAGGDGKKGKIFLEDKAGLMSLMSNITGDQASVARSKLDKQRQRTSAIAAQEQEASSANVDKAKLRQDKKKDRSRALRDAKAALVKEAKDKRRVKKGKPTDEDVTTEAKPKKKRVGFA